MSTGLRKNAYDSIVHPHSRLRKLDYSAMAFREPLVYDIRLCEAIGSRLEKFRVALVLGDNRREFQENDIALLGHIKHS